jgi:putative acetyltransferase
MGGEAVMAEARPKFGLRPMLPADVPTLADIFRASIEGLTGDAYDGEQQDAWASAADDEAAFAGRLADRVTLVATLQNSPVAFASLEGADKIDMLYVHPAVAGQGVATMLVDALEKLANARGAKRLTTDASDTARAFFDARGYTAQQRNTVLRHGQWLSNTTMTKDVAPSDRTELGHSLGGKKS